MKILPLVCKTCDFGFAILVDFEGRIFLFDSKSDKESYAIVDQDLIGKIECVVVGCLPDIVDSGLALALNSSKKSNIYISGNTLHLNDDKKKEIVNELLKGHLGRMTFTDGIKIVDRNIFALSRVWSKGSIESAANLSLVIRDNDGLVVFMRIDSVGVDKVFQKTIEMFPNDSVKTVVTRIVSSQDKPDSVTLFEMFCKNRGIEIIDVVSIKNKDKSEDSIENIPPDCKWIEV